MTDTNKLLEQLVADISEIKEALKTIAESSKKTAWPGGPNILTR
jgi:hypothetical protein